MAKTITVVRFKGCNYTPRDLLIQYARDHEPSVKFDYGVVPCLVIRGRRWAYDHWTIEDQGNVEVIHIDLVDIT